MKRKFTFLLAAIMLLTAKGMTAFGQTTYEKVTSTPTDWTGEYLLVFENDATTAYCWTGVDAASCYSEFPAFGHIGRQRIQAYRRKENLPPHLCDAMRL